MCERIPVRSNALTRSLTREKKFLGNLFSLKGRTFFEYFSFDFFSPTRASVIFSRMMFTEMFDRAGRRLRRLCNRISFQEFYRGTCTRYANISAMCVIICLRRTFLRSFFIPRKWHTSDAEFVKTRVSIYARAYPSRIEVDSTIMCTSKRIFSRTRVDMYNYN